MQDYLGRKQKLRKHSMLMSVHKTIYTAGKQMHTNGAKMLLVTWKLLIPYWFLQNVQRIGLTQFWWSALWNHLEESVDLSLLTSYPLKNYILPGKCLRKEFIRERITVHWDRVKLLLYFLATRVLHVYLSLRHWSVGLVLYKLVNVNTYMKEGDQ